MFNYYESYLSVRGGSGGKTFTQAIDNGRVTMTGTDLDGRHFQHIVFYQNGKIAERKFSLNGEMRSHLVYGSYIRKADGTIVRFKKGTKIGRHGKARHFEDLFGHKGVCHSWYSNGRTCLECGTKNRLPDIIDENKAPVCGQCKKPLTIEKSTATLEMFGEETGALKTDEPVTLIHPEHKKVELPKGEYVVKVQKEATGKNKSASVKD